MNNLQIFENKDFGSIRTVEIDGAPWFVGKDVATALGYSNTKDALSKHVDAEDKLGSRFATSGQAREMTIINESGLYSLILSSKLPTAKQFKRWVTSEVLPSIRKHGGYIAGQENLTSEQILANAVLLAQSVIAEKDNLIKQQEQMLAEYEPKVTYHDLILQTPDLLSVSQIAKDYGKSAQWLNDKLKEFGVQYKQGGVWLLRQEHAGFGYTKSKTSVYNDNDGYAHSKLHTYWTQKGRLFIYDLLKQHGYLPLIEQV